MTKRKYGRRVVTKTSHTRDQRKQRQPAPKPNANVRLSDSGAVRAMQRLSPDGQAMLFAMMRFTSTNGGDRFVLREASRAAGLEDNRAREGVNEMTECGLITAEPDGNVLLHPVFNGIGVHLRKLVGGRGENGCQMVEFGRR